MTCPETGQEEPVSEAQTRRRGPPLSLYDFLDKKKIPLPIFVAAISNRLPRVLPDEMDLYQLVKSVSAIRSELNLVKAKLDAIPSGTFSSVMDSLTEITGELKDVRGS